MVAAAGAVQPAPDDRAAGSRRQAPLALIRERGYQRHPRFTAHSYVYSSTSRTFFSFTRSVS